MQNETARTEVLNRLKNVRGHVAGVEKMVEEQQSCANILLQLSAIRSSVEKIGLYILEHNAVDCLCTDTNSSPEEKEKVQQVVKQMLSFLK